ncbi:ROK family transcriptional regulator [Nucisporomicrobium flavum]|uniref:ROK family transcriptional regulator n=1 Tax=Nucisporomicrobium flavum TaxID=2785915 RepID=UPI0018F78508|nr:ROK family transcriptional regulator [Nucisporomicrobium flavum]
MPNDEITGRVLRDAENAARRREPDRGTRLATIAALRDELDAQSELTEGDFSAWGMLVTDASLSADKEALEAARDGLHWLLRRYESAETGPAAQHRGRILGLVDAAYWAIRRLPSVHQLGPASGHSYRFLETVGEFPGMSNKELAAELRINETEVSRVGRRLRAAGLVWARRDWRRNAWDITPRGYGCLTESGWIPSSARDTVEPVVNPPSADTTAYGVRARSHRIVGVRTDGRCTVQQEATQNLTNPSDPACLSSAIVDVIRRLQRGTPGTENDLVAGVEIDGPVDVRAGTVAWSPQGSRGPRVSLALAANLEERTGLRVVVENDANALAIYEHKFGSNRGMRCAATVVLDDGVGCGIVVGKQLIRGWHGAAGEIGHMIVQPEGIPCRCGRKGCLESLAAPQSILELMREFDQGTSISSLAELAEHAEKRDKAALRALERAGTALGQGLCTLSITVDPEQVVVYGPSELMHENGCMSAAIFMSAVRAARDANLPPADRFAIVPKIYDALDGARAAAAVALRV